MKNPRPLLLVVPNNRDLLGEIAAAAGKAEVWVQATGHVEDVELRVAGPGADPRRRLEGRYTLAHFCGPVGGPYGVVLARTAALGVETVAGELLSARSQKVHCVLTAIDVATPEEEPKLDTGPALKAAEAKVAGTVPSNWALAAKAAAAAEGNAADEDEEEEPIERGDLVQHFAFGICEVLIENGNRLTLRDTHGPGRIREIVTDHLIISRPTHKDGKRLFKLSRKA